MKLKIRTRWKDIRQGTPRSVGSCALACAIKHQTGATAVIVSPDSDPRELSEIVIRDGKHAGVYAMSDRARRYAIKFDNQGRHSVRPSTFLFEKIS
jgi:hypothetical protein